MTDAKAAPDGGIDPVLVQAVRMVAKNPAQAEVRLREIWRSRPQELNAAIYLSRALRIQGKFKDATDVLENLKAAHPKFAVAYYELALTHADLGATGKAIAGLRKTAALDPNFPHVWLVLGDLLFKSGDRAAADEIYMEHVARSANAPYIRSAMAALYDNRPEDAVSVVQTHLAGLATDVAAIAVLAEAKARLNEYEDAAKLFEECLEKVPSFAVARLNYGTVLCRLQRPEDALVQTAMLLARDPHDPRFRELHATALNQAGNPSDAIACFESLLADFPGNHKSWTAFGHALRGSGLQERAVSAYRRSIAIKPDHGDAYWGIANLKTVPLSADEKKSIEKALAEPSVSDDDRIHLHFALGKVFEDEHKYAQSFAHYEKGNSLCSAKVHYDPDHLAYLTVRSTNVFTRALFEDRRGAGATAGDPIFILGMPRSGSTLIEQILASHSAVEGTAELPDMRMISQQLDSRRDDRRLTPYPVSVADLPREKLRKLGQDYLALTRRHRKTDRPRFTDKMPANFEHIGLIHLILPNARIIDARRHPLGCCLSNYKQLYAQGQNFSYDLTMLGRYYAGYVELMAHFDAVLPGRIHRVLHEDIVADPEREIRRLLDYCGLNFEPSCMKFYDTERTVRTVSSEQVRRPIFADGVDQWRNYEPWLGPLKEALGPVLEAYPDVPEFGGAE